MKINPIALAGLALLTITGSSWAQGERPTARQDDKNLMRNLGTGLGAAALDALIRGRRGDALLLGAGAALSGKKYEDARKAQRDEDRCEQDDFRDRDLRSSRWERERRERELRERREQEARERLRRERIERERREQREREEREERRRWEREHRGQYWNRDRDCRERDHRHN